MDNTNSETILIKDILLNGKSCDIFIKDRIFDNIAPNLRVKADITINGHDKMILPSFANCHTSAALSLLKGFTEGISRKTMLQKYLIPLTGCLNEDDVYWGTRLACLEMIKSGTTFFSDNYLHWWGAAKAVHEMGMRSVLTLPFQEHADKEILSQMKHQIKQIHYSSNSYSDRIGVALGAHFINELSDASLHWIAEYANKHKLHIHLPLACSQEEGEESIATYGQRPLQRLDKVGLVNERLSIIYAPWLEESEIELLAERNGKIVHCPSAAMKLAFHPFNWIEAEKIKVPVVLGTAGTLLSGHQNMLQEARMASLEVKAIGGDAAILPAQVSLDMATKGAATLFGINNGEIATGKLADCIIINLAHPSLVPNHNDIANLVYSADTGSIETTICNGNVLMHKGVVPYEKKILEKSRETVARILSRLDSLI